MELLYSRSFVLYTSNRQASRPFRTENGVARGSVLAHCLYNIYTADFPETSAKQYMYTDDVALTGSATTFREAELALSHDISVVNAYLTKWKLRLSVEKTVCSVFHLKNHSVNYQLNVKLKPNATRKVELTSIRSRHMHGSLSVVQDTLTHTQEESFITSGTHQATGRCRLGSFIQSSQNLLLGTCICSGRVLCPRVVPQRSHKTHQCAFKQVDARYHWLPTKHLLLLLAHSIWHYPI